MVAGSGATPFPLAVFPVRCLLLVAVAPVPLAVAPSPVAVFPFHCILPVVVHHAPSPLYYIISHYNMLYYIIVYHIILYYMILYCIIEDACGGSSPHPLELETLHVQVLYALLLRFLDVGWECVPR